MLRIAITLIALFVYISVFSQDSVPHQPKAERSNSAVQPHSQKDSFLKSATNANFAVRCPICRFSYLCSCCKVWLLRSSPLPRQALEGLYAVVNPHIRIFSRQ